MHLLLPRYRLASGTALLALSAASTTLGAVSLAAGAAQAAVSAPPAALEHAVAAASQAPALVTTSAPVSPFETVAPGDTLSGISQRRCGTASDWSGIYYANKAKLRGPDLITAGLVLRVSCTDPGYTYPRPKPVATVQETVQQQAQPSVRTSSAPAQAYTGSGAFQQCVIARESGGDSQIMNGSGHYGLYQFSYTTWVAHGGSPADFGHASVTEQNQVFYNTVAQDGTSDWRPYDDC